MLEWDFGAIWILDRAAHALRCIDTWRPPSAPASAFEAATLARVFPRGIGLPGRVWSTAAPVSIPDVVVDDNFPRAPLALAAGLHGAFGFPSASGSRWSA